MRDIPLKTVYPFYQLALTTLFAIGGIFTTTNTRVTAQIIPDNTLGTEKSVVDQVNELKDLINGGAARGTNLFHSFENFNVGENRSVYFANPVGIENILTRVTGGNYSHIFGKLGVKGTANLFLLNPNGIIFGENASLDIRGSFTATTADSIRLGENSLFSATHPQNSNLLTVQPGVLLKNAIKNQVAEIRNEGNLIVDEGQNITFFGANVINLGELKATGGRVELTGTENLQIQIRGNLETGTLLLDTQNLTIGENDNTTIQKNTLEGLPGDTNIIFQAANDITINPLSDNSLNFTEGSGEITFIADFDSNGVGDFQMNIADIIQANGKRVDIKGVNLTVGNIGTNSELGGGNITLTAAGGNISTQLLDSSSLSFAGTGGNGGAISLDSGGNISTQLLNSSSFSDSGTAGNGGAISLVAGGNISTQLLDSSTFVLEGIGGNGGAISLDAGGNISNQLLNSSSFSDSGTGGNGGKISLDAGGNISTQFLDSSSFSDSGTGGNGSAISLDADGDISTQVLNSSSYSESGTAGNGGKIYLAAGGDIKRIRDEFNQEFPVLASFSVSETGNSGKGGNVFLTAKNQITDLEILTLSSDDKSGDVQIEASGNLSITNTDIITSKQLTIQIPNFGDINLDIGEVGQSGNVDISSTGNLTFQNSRIESDTKGINPAGNVTITSPNTVTFNNSEIISSTSSTGNAGNIEINANTLTLTDASKISASTTVDGKAGDITLNTPSLTVAKGAKIFATTTSNGDGGTITINADNEVNLGIGVQDFAPILSVETSSAGKAGNIIVNTPSLTVSDTARITATATATATNPEGGGSITLNASKLDLAGVVGVFAETKGQAPAGTLTINPYQNQPNLDLTLFKDSEISASTNASGKGGDLIITAPENINIVGQGKLAVESEGTGDAGNISITTQNLNITDGVQISASTSNTGKGGNINVNANTLTMTNGGQFLTTTSGNAQAGNINLIVKENITLDGTNTGLFANTEPRSTGNSGSIDIDPITFIIRNGAGIGVNSQGSGEGGDIDIVAGTLRLENQGFITAETVSNQGGAINLNIQELLLLRNNSKITATAGTDGAGGDGGNININTPFMIAFPSENSDITANAFEGNGGQINITTNGLFGIEFQTQQTPRSDITASSQFGLSGEVQITRPDVDPTSGLIELPSGFIDATNQLSQECRDGGTENTFTIVGKGGLPSSPNDLFTGVQPLVDVVDMVDNQEISKGEINKSDLKNPVIQEAQGWVITNDGRIILTAQSPRMIFKGSGLSHPGCEVFSNK